MCWHVGVDHDILRGSGRKLPNEVALACGVNVGDALHFTGPGNGVPVRWSVTSHVGAAIGSMRSLAEDCGGRMGDVMRIRFDLRDHSVTAELRPADVSTSSEAQRLSAYTGLPLEDCRSLSALAESISTSAPEVADRLEGRGDALAAVLARALPPTEAS